jgi:hypothetical protein
VSSCRDRPSITGCALLTHQVRQRCDVLAQLVDSAVDEVPDDRHDVRALFVDQLHQPLEPPSAIGGRERPHRR